MQVRKSERNFIAGDNGAFDAFFIQLRATLLGGTAEASVDEVGQAIFRVGLKGQPSGSGRAQPERPEPHEQRDGEHSDDDL
jgi:hypothetical protein